uniref:Uncharacterized protein n=1 Tax=Anopheles albimanus TaxID=7167 RepID=A0A182FCT2_ANOAL
MKSLSLDSPESSELHGQIRRRHPGPTGHGTGHGGSGGQLEHSTPPSNNSRLHSPSSPSGTQRKFLYATRGMKTGSVDLPDEVEKSLSSASTSPCPSPVRQSQKSHRLLPTNLYVVLYNFKSRHQDELDLKAGYKVTVIDTSDPDWWKGKCLGKVGYFPSKYCAKLAASEKPLQVTHNLQVTDNERGEGTLTLLRDQIVIQVGEELNGMVMVRSADNRQGVCPVKYLQEHTSSGAGKSGTTTINRSSRKEQQAASAAAAAAQGATATTTTSGSRRSEHDGHKDQCHTGGHHYHRESRNHFHKSYDRSWEKWEKFREKKMEMMKAHKYNVEHRLKYDNQERILYRHHFNYYPVKRPRPRKTSLEPNWYTENIYSNQSIDNSDGEHAGMGAGGSFPTAGTPGHRNLPASALAARDINGNLSMGGLDDDGGIFTIDGHLERRNPAAYPKSSSCCFASNPRMWDIEEGDGLELDEWNERYPKIPKSYSFSTSRSMGAGFNMAKLYNRNSFEMPEFPSQRRHRQQLAGFDRSIVRMCDREGCFNETCFTSKEEKNFFNNNNHNNQNQNHQQQQQHHHHHRNHLLQQHNNNSTNLINNNTSSVGNNHSSNLISEWNLRNRNNMRVRGEPMEDGSRPQYVMEEDFDLFDDDDDDEDEEEDAQKEDEEEDEGVERDEIVEGEEESDLNTLYADDRHSIAYGDYGRVARDFCARTPRHRGCTDDDVLFRTTFGRPQQLRSRSQLLSDRDDYRKSLEDFFNQNCCIEQQLHHRHRQQQQQQQQQMLLRDRDRDRERFLGGSGKPPKTTKSMLEVKPPNRFDDTSSDSTDLELEDFNFDFEKYWEELEKPSPTSPSELEERYGGVAGAVSSGGSRAHHHGKAAKVKNVNLNRCYNNGTVIDIYHDDDPYHRDHYHYREGGLHGARSVKASNHAHNVHINNTSNNNNNNSVHRVPQQHHHTTPRSKGSRHKVYPSASDGPRLAGLVDEGDGGGGKQQGTTTTTTASVPGSAINNNSNAISFLNNIFSIYKPNKYSPLNCHVEQNYLKNIPAKKMNIVASSAAARPLGSRTTTSDGGGADGSSTKRPLTVHPAKARHGATGTSGGGGGGSAMAATVRRATSSAAAAARHQQAASKDPQARFQIIPDKTGVKISPLYRLDAQDYRRARYKLKSTSRPLSFW